MALHRTPPSIARSEAALLNRSTPDWARRGSLTTAGHSRGSRSEVNTFAAIVTSNRETDEVPAQLAHPLLAQSAIDRLRSAAHQLVIEGES